MSKIEVNLGDGNVFHGPFVVAGRISGAAIPGAKRSPLRVAARDRRRGGGPAIDPMHSLAEAYPADRRRSSTPKMVAPSPQMMSSMPSMPAEDPENYVF